MGKIFLSNTNGIPQIGCSTCYECNSIFGKSLCEVKKRGCCWYFPKFNLYEIQKMAKSSDGLEILKKIINMPNTVVYNYYIHAKGFFDEKSYNKYINTKGKCSLEFAIEKDVKEIREEILYEDEEYEIYKEYDNQDLIERKQIKKPRVIKDVSMFFRSCPFVISGKGCTLNSQYRSYVCNFFICDEIVENLYNNNEFKKYTEERDNYIRWIEWENSSLQSLLIENNINLINNFDEVIKVLQRIQLNEYEFPNLDEITFV
ncbi:MULTISPECIES: hypothetical protein [unclassified Clostridium]|uniref:hypothetical protein n=1 Tax=unclassified Clostridium TaxID=2614128 RepID=UPI00189840B1|nr:MULTISPECIES: hypothetical protein [unclassified Clostridium]MBP3915193.1 hypothetical protein [Clostridium sp.]